MSTARSAREGIGFSARRTGHALVMVLLVTTIVGGSIAAMAKWSVEGYQTRQADRARLIARALTDSAAGYARAHLPEWSAKPPAEAVTPDVGALLPRNAVGSVSISFELANGQRVCRVSGKVQIGPSSAVDAIVLNVPSAAETQPGARR